uniref:Uncharacterized protein n=1 Tax=Oryzias sinensis TaxID=183150 RepID=A0A8C7WY22_9TELE
MRELELIRKLVPSVLYILGIVCIANNFDFFIYFSGCYGCWCGPCLACTVSGRFGERYCLPMLDISTTGSQILPIPAFVPPVAVSMRAAMRSRYGIKGSIAADIAASYYCAPCSWCQMHRELNCVPLLICTRVIPSAILDDPSIDVFSLP